MALIKNNISTDINNAFFDTNVGAFHTFGTLIAMETNSAALASAYTKVSLGNPSKINKSFFADIDNALNEKIGDKTYGIFRQESDLYLIPIKSPKTKNLFTAIIRNNAEAFSGINRVNNAQKMETTVSAYHERIKLANPASTHKLFFATNGPFFKFRIPPIDNARYSESATPVGKHQVIGMTFYKDQINNTLSNLSIEQRTNQQDQQLIPYTKRTRFSLDGYHVRALSSDGAFEFGYGETNYKRGNPNNTANETNDGSIRVGFGGLSPMIMTYSGPGIPKFTLKFGDESIDKATGDVVEVTTHTDLNVLKTLSQKRSQYWVSLSGWTSNNIGYNILAYHPAKDLALVIIQQHSFAGAATFDWADFIEMLYQHGFEFAVSFDASDSVFLYDYDLNDYAFVTKDKGKDYSTEVGYGFSK